MGKTSRDNPDIYYQQAKQEGFRARSAFKLTDLNQRFNFLKDARNVVDLCAAPGSWTQILAEELKPLHYPEVNIVAVDIQAMAPLPGVTILQGDITKESTALKIITKFSGKKADLVVCDGAPDVTGIHDIDEYFHGELLTCALNITTYILKESGAFVAKIFKADNISFLESQMRLFFPEVTIMKPPSSRNDNIEAFIICQNYKPPKGYVPSIWKSLKCGQRYDFKGNKCNAKIIPFVVSGDLNNYDTENKCIVVSDFMDCLFKEPLGKPRDTSL